MKPRVQDKTTVEDVEFDEPKPNGEGWMDE